MSTTIVPPHNEQYMAALARANAIRFYRAQLKRDVKAGRVTAYGLVACPPEMAQTMQIFELLRAMPHVGRVRANKLLQHCRVSPSKTLAGLTERQRTELLALLGQNGRTV